MWKWNACDIAIRTVLFDFYTVTYPIAIYDASNEQRFCYVGK